jgi:hypothetical protein
MTFYTKDAKRTQTTWGPHGPEKTWHAYIDADIQDQVVIEQAKQIVDGCSPQRYGPHGAQAYSFLKREYLLNLILFHYVDHGFFPSGHICITDEWLYSDSLTTDSKSRWYSFRPRKKGRNYFAGWWIKIPSLAEIESSNVEGVPS